jgi:RNA polymerase sigma-70 factor (ECF subfamily)
VTDEQLMLDVQRGSREAFIELFGRYRGPIWRFFRRRVADAARSEELAQDVFLAVLQGSARYEPRASFRSYLFAIAFNLLLADQRKAAHRAVETLTIEPSAAHADLDTALWVQRALESLDPPDREILMLREYEQLTYEEIAHVLTLPINTVRSRLFRARLALKAVFEQQLAPRAKVGHAGR